MDAEEIEHYPAELGAELKNRLALKIAAGRDKDLADGVSGASYQRCSLWINPPLARIERTVLRRTSWRCLSRIAMRISLKVRPSGAASYRTNNQSGQPRMYLWGCHVSGYILSCEQEKMPLAPHDFAPMCDYQRTYDLAMEAALPLYWNKWLRQHGKTFS